MKIDRSRLLLLLFVINSIHRKRLFSAAPSDPDSMNGASAKKHAFIAQLNLIWGDCAQSLIPEYAAQH